MDVELVEVRDFLAACPPFDLLPREVITSLPRRMRLVYVRRGTALMQVGVDNHDFYVVRSGAVDIRNRAGALIERGDVGTCFGTTTLINGNPSRFTVEAIEDCLVLVLPGEDWHLIAGSHLEFRDFFHSQRAIRMRGAVASIQVADTGSAILKTRVADMIRRPPVTTPGQTSIRDAAARMAQGDVSCILVTDADRLVGIVTDRDLRGRVVAKGADVDVPVTSIMSADPSTTSAEALAFEVLIQMMNDHIHHLPVVADGRPVGVVTSTDLIRLEHANPIHLVRDIAVQADVTGIAAVCARLPTTVERLASQDASAADVGRVVTAVGDAVSRRLIELAEAELGPVPGGYCWFALGSQARFELSLSSDQDHALVLADDAPPGLEPYTAALAARVTAGLEACGYPRCDGDVMATNPRWRQPLAQWRREFARWISTPHPDAVLHAGIFFDARPLHGDAALVGRLLDEACASAAHSPRFLAHLTRNAVAHRPPIGFFRDFVLTSEDDRKDSLDLKWGGVGAVHELARVFALSIGSTQVSTHGRIDAAVAAGRMSAERGTDLLDAYEFLSYVRLRHQAARVKEGLPPDNHVRPADLSGFDKRHLRDAFGIIRSAQNFLARSNAEATW